MSSGKMIIEYFGEKKTFEFIKDYNQFITKCHQEFDMSEEEIKSFKLYKLDEGDEIDIEKEDDFIDNIEEFNDNGEIIFIIKSSGRKKKEDKKEEKHVEEEKKEEESKEEKKEEKEKKEEQQKSENKTISSSIQDTGSSKVKESSTENENIKEEMKKMFEEMKKLIQESNEERKKAENEIKEENKKNMKKNIGEVKQFLLQLESSIKESNEERKKTENELKEENKKNIKKNISEVKQFLIKLEEEMKENNTKINDSMTQISSLQNNPKEEQINKSMLDAISESTVKKSTELEEQIKKLDEKIQKISEIIENQSKIQVQQIKEEEKFYGCSFDDGNYILNMYYDDLMNMKFIKYDITLTNNGTLPWPENAYVNGKSNDNILECKSITVNKNKQIEPKEKIVAKILVNLSNIQNQNCEITLPINLFFQNQSIQIKQNGFKIIIKVKETKIITSGTDKQNIENINTNPINNPTTESPSEVEKTKPKEVSPHQKIPPEEPNSQSQKKKPKSNHSDTEPNPIETKPNPSKNKNLVSQEMFEKIKEKLEEDYSFSNYGLNDDDLMKKIKINLTDNLRELIGKNNNKVIEDLVELIGEQMLEI